ncbi:Coiled-coil domain-containing protein 78 [Acropora cervicornis]|uniref:Coiled-coil domain-containing protein 78 n=1 Tax=Acropora cervicornis TaxID=6130 RepID=A0AAD9VCV2_ACRCE|nr:Coiled-coil domain-containing protein 78 [Acropora cervicornis]
MNIEVLARVRPPKRGDRFSLNISGSRVQAGDGTGHIFASLYKPESQTYDIFRDSFSPLVDLLIAGYNVCVLVFGETGSGKSFSLAGEKNAKAGMIPLIINSVFTKMRNERSANVRVQRNEVNDGVVFVQFVEVYNEKLRDLLVLPHEDRNVDVAEDGLNGAYVQNATHKRVTDAAECTSLFRQGWANRTKSQTDFESRATVFFTLDITMLAEDLTQLRMREGPMMNKAVVSFGNLVSKLAASQRSSRVIQYGTKALITLDAVDTPNLSVVLKTAGQLAQVQNYPIINDSMAKLQERNEQLHTRLGDVQARYSELMKSKTLLSSKLISSEEEKLRILALENKVMELQLYLDKANSDQTATREQLDGMEIEHKELVNEYIALKTSHVQLTSDYQKEVTKNEELGLELVTLLNIKEKLQHDKESVELEKMQEYYDQLRRITSKFSRSSLREKDDLSRSVLNLQSEKFELEKQLLHNSQQREGKVETLRELISANGERHRLTEENNHLDERLKELTAEYNNRLQQYIHDIAVFCEQAKEKHSSGESLQWYVDVMVGQMTYAHETREQDLQSKIHELKATVKDITQKNENLSSAYRRGHQAPQADQAEFYFPSDIELSMAQSREIAQLQSELKEMKYTNDELKQKVIICRSSNGRNGLGLFKEATQRIHTQHTDLESERASLLTRCILAEEQQARLQHYIDTNLKRCCDRVSVQNRR